MSAKSIEQEIERRVEVTAMKRTRVTRIKRVAGPVISAAILIAGSALAGLTDTDYDKNGLVAESSGAGALFATSTFASSPSSFGPVDLTVHVDETACATGAIQCAEGGHTFEAAGRTNHNPVRLGIQVLAGRKPVNGLRSDAFSVFNRFVPAGGGGVDRDNCTQCFQSVENGLYALFVHPLPSVGNWVSGSYFVQVIVKVPVTNGTTNSTRTERALLEIEIPFD